MTTRLARRAKIAIELSFRLQLSEGKTIIETRCQSNHPLLGTPALDRFRSWAVDVARGPVLRLLLKQLGFDLPRRRGGYG